MIDVSVDSLYDEGIDIREENGKSKSLVSFGNLDNDYFHKARVMGKSAFIRNDKQDADRVAKLALDSNRSRCHFVRSSSSESAMSILSSDNGEMNITLEELDGPTTYLSQYLNFQSSGQGHLCRSETGPTSSRVQTIEEDSNMTLFEETKLPKIKTELYNERQRRARDKHGNIKSLFHKGKRQEEP